MKLFLFACVIGLGRATEQNLNRISVEKGGKWGKESCKDATKWTLSNPSSAGVETLEATTEEKQNDNYELKGNEITIKPDKKKRHMMGQVKCWKRDEELATLDVTGKPVFKNLPNALTNLNQDENKRIECEVTGYPIPTVYWKFQAIEEAYIKPELYNEICPQPATCNINLCKENCDAEEKCTDEKCEGDDCEVKKDQCIVHAYNNATDLFDILDNGVFATIDVRYANSTAEGCPMNGELKDKEATCDKVKSTEEVNQLDDVFKPKSQLLFQKLEYAQAGKYICIAEQKLDSKTITKTRAFVWLVKDPMAALWPFLALVAEVIVVVCIILYYERASQKGESESEEEEEGTFIESKKEES